MNYHFQNAKGDQIDPASSEYTWEKNTAKKGPNFKGNLGMIALAADDIDFHQPEEHKPMKQKQKKSEL